MSSQLDYIEVYKRAFSLIDTSFSEGVTGQRTSVLNLELIFFSDSLSDATENVFFDRGQNEAEDFLWSDWRAELFLVNSWMTRSLLLSDLNTELFLMSEWLLLSILNTKLSLVNSWVTCLLLLSSLITVLSLVNSWVTWVHVVCRQCECNTEFLL